MMTLGRNQLNITTLKNQSFDKKLELLFKNKADDKILIEDKQFLENEVCMYVSVKHLWCTIFYYTILLPEKQGW